MSVSQRLQRLEEISSRLAQEISALKREAAEADPTPGREPEGSAGPASALALYLSLGQGYEKDALLRMILECAMHTVHAGGAGLTLLDPKKDRLVFQAAVGDGAEGIIGYEVPLEGSRHGLAFATGEIQSSTPIHKEIESATGASFRNVLVAPLMADGQPLGTISAVNKKDGDHFTPGDMESYRLFSELAALVVRHKLREEILTGLMRGDSREIPAALQGLGLGKESALLLDIFRDVGLMARQGEDALSLAAGILNLAAGMRSASSWRF